MSLVKFVEGLHPRDAHGRFKSKGSVGVRVSTRSVSVNAGQRFPIIPGKVNLYVGALVRVENASRSKGPISKAGDKATANVLNRLPEGKFKQAAAGLASSGQHQSGATLLTGSTGRRSTPTLRVSRATGASSLRPGGNTYTQGVAKARRPRAPRKPRAKRVITP